MNATSYFDYIMLLLGWLSNNVIWYSIATSGIVIIPFILKLLDTFRKTKEEGSDEENTFLILNRLEVYFYTSILIIFATCAPVLEPDFKVYKYEQTKTDCSFNEVSISGSSFQSLASDIDGQSIKIPVWWYGVHALSQGLTRASITAIPCKVDIRRVAVEVQKLQINDPILLEEVKQFYANCFNPSFNKLQDNSRSLSNSMINDVYWPGSTFYLTEPGYYDSFRALTPQKDWPYDPNRDVGLTPGDNYTGYPGCKSWWQDSNVGLRTKLLNEADNMGDTLKYTESIGFFTSKADKEEVYLKSLTTPSKFVATKSTMFSDYSGNNDKTLMQHVSGFFSTIGLAWNSMSSQLDADGYRKMAPFIQSCLLFVVIILLPIVITASGFSPKAVITTTFIIFGIIFLSFFWEMGRFLDTKLIDIIYDGSQVGRNPKDFLSIENSKDIKDLSIIRIITSVIFIGFPIILLASFSWAGHSIGNAVNSALGSMGEPAERAGSQGAGKVASAAKTVMTRKGK